MSTRKYRPGDTFKTTGELVDWSLAGGFVYLRQGLRPTHTGWICSMTVHTLEGFVRSGAAHQAILIEPKESK